MGTSDIVITIVIALAVNLATPLVRNWLVSGFTKVNVAAGSASVKILNIRLRQLKDALEWYREKNDAKELLRWLLPRVFEQIIFLWLLVLLPYFLEMASGFWDIPEVVSKGGLYGIVGLCTRYFFSFIVVVTLAQKSLYHSETEMDILRQINKITETLSAKNS